nr:MULTISPECIES: fimbrial protein [Serratia]
MWNINEEQAMKAATLAASVFMLNILLFNRLAWGDTDINFYGTLIAPPLCEVNEGNNIDVPFGNVGINKVDGINYLTTLDYTVSCESSTQTWVMYLTLTGDMTAYDGAAVNTTVSGLGIKVFQNGLPFTLGEPVPVNPSALPVLTAVPIKDPVATLTEGNFVGTATLQAEYQ